MRNNFDTNMFAENDPIVNYLGTYTVNQPKFKLLGGRVIKSLVEYCRGIYVEPETNSLQSGSSAAGSGIL